MRSVLFGAALAFVSLGAAAQEMPKGDAKAGEAAFMKMGCYTCHGVVGQGTGRDGPRINPPLPYPALLAQLRTPRYEMPAYVESAIPDQGVADIHAYLAGLPKGPDPKSIGALQ